MATYETVKPKGRAVVDLQSGEITDLVITRKITLDEFIMVFFSSCPQLMELKGNHLKVLICCWKYSSYNPDNEERGNLIYNGPGFKQSCRENGLDVSNAIIDNAISALHKKGFLIKRFRGEYMLNPEYFFKGRLTDRSKVRMNVIVDSRKNEE